MEKIYSLQPILCENPTLLMLGSVPSIASMEARQFYGHPRNHFWPLMAAVLGEDDPHVYAERTAMLQRHGVALWDSIRACVRAGSLDKDVREAEPNDIGGLLDAHPSIRAVAFNGILSEKVYDEHFARKDAVAYLRLPSSSPVPRRRIKTMEDKLDAWMALRGYIAL